MYTNIYMYHYQNAKCFCVIDLNVREKEEEEEEEEGEEKGGGNKKCLLIDQISLFLNLNNIWLI
jgi:hypothetical protein